MRFVTGSAAATVVALIAAGSHAAPARESRIAFSGTDGNNFGRIYTIRPDGRDRRVVSRFPPRRGRIDFEGSPAWSPDGRQLAFVRGTWSQGPAEIEIRFEIFVSRADGTQVHRVTPGDGDGSPAWSPDAKTIVFTRDGYIDKDEGLTASYLFLVGSDGTSPRQLTSEHLDSSPHWSPDGKTILFARSPAFAFVTFPEQARLMLMDADGSNVRPFPRGVAGAGAVWSPNGKRVAFTSYRDKNGKRCPGRDDCFTMGELYVMNADGTGLRRLTRNKMNDVSPTWSPDGKWIAFSSGRTDKGPLRYRILRIRATGGRARLIARMDRSVGGAAWRPR